MQPRYLRISYCKDNVEGDYGKIVRSVDRDVPDLGKNSLDKNFDGNVSSVVFGDLATVCMIMCARHCELPLNLTDEQFREVIQKGIQIINHYLYGNWYLRERATRQLMGWSDKYPEGILCALLLDDEKAIKEIADYLDEDIVDSDAYLLNNLDEMCGRFLVLHAIFLAGKNYDAYAHLAEQIRKGKKKRAKLLLDVLEAIVAKDNDRFGKTFQEYIKYFNKREVDLDSGSSDNISILGSILWETARISGISLPQLPEEIMDRVITRETIGLQK